MTTTEPSPVEYGVMLPIVHTLEELDVARRQYAGDKFAEHWLDRRQRALTAGIVADWNPLLHPRGHDGKFIKVGGWVKVFRKDGWYRGQVDSIAPNGVIVVLGDTGWSAGISNEEATKRIFSLPTPKASLSLPDPTTSDPDPGWKKTGGQGGSNPGGLYEKTTISDKSQITRVPGKLQVDPNPAMQMATGPMPGYKLFTDDIVLRLDDDGTWHDLGTEDVIVEQSVVDELKADLAKAVADLGSGQPYTPQPIPIVDDELLDAAMAKVGTDEAKPKAVASIGVSESAYVKLAKSTDHARHEWLANQLYELAGTPIPEVYVGQDGQTVASKIVPNPKPLSTATPDQLSQLRSDFVVDAWLSNWDVVGLEYDNVVISEGVPYRIDAGGALKYRAQGGAKGKMFGPKVGELSSMVDSSLNPQAAKYFGPTTDAELADGLARIKAISHDELADMVSAAGLDSGTVDLLEARRADIAEQLAYLDTSPILQDEVDAKLDTKYEALDPSKIADLTDAEAEFADNGGGWTSLGVYDPAVSTEEGEGIQIGKGHGQVLPGSVAEGGFNGYVWGADWADKVTISEHFDDRASAKAWVKQAVGQINDDKSIDMPSKTILNPIEQAVADEYEWATINPPTPGQTGDPGWVDMGDANEVNVIGDYALDVTGFPTDDYGTEWVATVNLNSAEPVDETNETFTDEQSAKHWAEKVAQVANETGYLGPLMLPDGTFAPIYEPDFVPADLDAGSGWTDVMEQSVSGFQQFDDGDLHGTIQYNTTTGKWEASAWETGGLIDNSGAVFEYNLGNKTEAMAWVKDKLASTAPNSVDQKNADFSAEITNPAQAELGGWLVPDSGSEVTSTTYTIPDGGSVARSWSFLDEQGYTIGIEISQAPPASTAAVMGMPLQWRVTRSIGWTEQPIDGVITSTLGGERATGVVIANKNGIYEWSVVDAAGNQVGYGTDDDKTMARQHAEIAMQAYGPPGITMHEGNESTLANAKYGATHSPAVVLATDGSTGAETEAAAVEAAHDVMEPLTSAEIHLPSELPTWDTPSAQWLKKYKLRTRGIADIAPSSTASYYSPTYIVWQESVNDAGPVLARVDAYTINEGATTGDLSITIIGATPGDDKPMIYPVNRWDTFQVVLQGGMGGDDKWTTEKHLANYRQTISTGSVSTTWPGTLVHSGGPAATDAKSKALGYPAFLAETTDIGPGFVLISTDGGLYTVADYPVKIGSMAGSGKWSVNVVDPAGISPAAGTSTETIIGETVLVLPADKAPGLVNDYKDARVAETALDETAPLPSLTHGLVPTAKIPNGEALDALVAKAKAGEEVWIHQRMTSAANTKPADALEGTVGKLTGNFVTQWGTPWTPSGNKKWAEVQLIGGGIAMVSANMVGGKVYVLADPPKSQPIDTLTLKQNDDVVLNGVVVGEWKKNDDYYWSKGWTATVSGEFTVDGVDHVISFDSDKQAFRGAVMGHAILPPKPPAPAKTSKSAQHKMAKKNATGQAPAKAAKPKPVPAPVEQTATEEFWSKVPTEAASPVKPESTAAVMSDGKHADPGVKVKHIKTGIEGVVLKPAADQHGIPGFVKVVPTDETKWKIWAANKLESIEPEPAPAEPVEVYTGPLTHDGKKPLAGTKVTHISKGISGTIVKPAADQHGVGGYYYVKIPGETKKKIWASNKLDVDADSPVDEAVIAAELPSVAEPPSVDELVDMILNDPVPVPADDEFEKVLADELAIEKANEAAKPEVPKIDVPAPGQSPEAIAKWNAEGRKLMADGNVPYIGMTVREKSGKPYVVMGISNPTSNSKNTLKLWSADDKKMVSRAVTKLSFDPDSAAMQSPAVAKIHVQSIIKGYGGEPPSIADSSEVFDVPDGAVIYKITARPTQSYGAEPETVEVAPQYAMVMPDGKATYWGPNPIGTSNEDASSILGDILLSKKSYSWKFPTSSKHVEIVGHGDAASPKAISVVSASMNTPITGPSTGDFDAASIEKKYVDVSTLDSLGVSIAAQEATAAKKDVALAKKVLEQSQPDVVKKSITPDGVTPQELPPKLVAVGATFSPTAEELKAAQDAVKTPHKKSGPPPPTITGQSGDWSDKPHIERVHSVSESIDRIIEHHGDGSPGSGADFALADGDKIVDMRVRTTPVITADGKEAVEMRFKLTQAHSDTVGKTLVTEAGKSTFGSWQADMLNVKFLKQGDKVRLRDGQGMQYDTKDEDGKSTGSGPPKILKPVMSSPNSTEGPNFTVSGPPVLLPELSTKTDQSGGHPVYRVRVVNSLGEEGEVDIEDRGGELSFAVWHYDPLALVTHSEGAKAITPAGELAGWQRVGSIGLTPNKGNIWDKAGRKVYDGTAASAPKVINHNGSSLYRPLDDGAELRYNYALPTEGPTVSTGTTTPTARGSSLNNEVVVTVPVDGLDPDQARAAAEKALSNAMEAVGVNPDVQRPPTNAELRRMAISKVKRLFESSGQWHPGEVVHATGYDDDPETQAILADVTKRLDLDKPMTMDDLIIYTETDGRVWVGFSDEVVRALANKKDVGWFVTDLSYMGGANGMSMPEIAASILGGPNNGLLTSDERWSRGFSTNGGSSDTDLAKGTGDRVYLTSKPKSSSIPTADWHVVLTPEAVLRSTEVYAGTGNDSFGTKGNKAWEEVGAIFENMFKLGVPLDWVGFVFLPSYERDKLIAELKKRGVTEINGRPVEEVILVAGSKPSSEQVKKVHEQNWNLTGVPVAEAGIVI